MKKYVISVDLSNSPDETGRFFIDNDEKLKNRIIKTLKMGYCPKEFKLDVICKEHCSTENMKPCWDNVLKNYDIKVSNKYDLKYLIYGCSFKFENRKEKN